MEVFGICDKNEYDWIQLMREAKELGLSIEEVRRFLNETKKEE